MAIQWGPPALKQGTRQRAKEEAIVPGKTSSKETRRAETTSHKAHPSNI